MANKLPEPPDRVDAMLEELSRDPTRPAAFERDALEFQLNVRRAGSLSERIHTALDRRPSDTAPLVAAAAQINVLVAMALTRGDAEWIQRVQDAACGIADRDSRIALAVSILRPQPEEVRRVVAIRTAPALAETRASVLARVGRPVLQRLQRLDPAFGSLRPAQLAATLEAAGRAGAGPTSALAELCLACGAFGVKRKKKFAASDVKKTKDRRIAPALKRREKAIAAMSTAAANAKGPP